MGDHNVNLHNFNRRQFVRHLLNDIRALEQLLEKNLIEDDITRIGAEQEFCLVNKTWRPATNSGELLATVNDPHFTTELAVYNLEINLDPFELDAEAFSKMEQQLQDLLSKAQAQADILDSKVVLTGILPTISKNELEFEFMTPNPRYWALNEVMKELRGGDFSLHLEGVDELSITHDSVLFEACNTSFQLHLQIAPNDFVASYNWAQAIAGPVLGICTNSPLLLGRELWHETRIALFQQSIDTRMSSYALKESHARVSFGDGWASGNAADLFKHSIACHNVILSKEIETNSLGELEAGRIPKLQALNLHNGTVYHWNRPCYGVGNGRAHLRIENRYIPAGPSISDEIANFVFWVGLMLGRPAEFDSMPEVMDFKDAKGNFISAARYGKDSVLSWKGKAHRLDDLIRNELLPIARVGLKSKGLDSEKNLGWLQIIESRLDRYSGSQWQVKNYRKARTFLKQDDALRLITKSIYENQTKNIPVSEWPDINIHSTAHEHATQVQHIMSTRLFVVNENDLAELATDIMEWKGIHHVPVLTSRGLLTGLLTWTHMKRYREEGKNSDHLSVKDIMVTQLISVHPKTSIAEAIQLMKQHKIGCLPVVDKDHLVGIITIDDVLEFDR